MFSVHYFRHPSVIVRICPSLGISALETSGYLTGITVSNQYQSGIAGSVMMTSASTTQEFISLDGSRSFHFYFILGEDGVRKQSTWWGRYFIRADEFFFGRTKQQVTLHDCQLRIIVFLEIVIILIMR